MARKYRGAELSVPFRWTATCRPTSSVPEPTDAAALMPDELPLDMGDEAEAPLPPLGDGDTDR